MKSSISGSEKKIPIIKQDIQACPEPKKASTFRIPPSPYSSKARVTPPASSVRTTVQYSTDNVPGPRKEVFYFSDDGDLSALRYQDWKLIFMEQKAMGTFRV